MRLIPLPICASVAVLTALIYFLRESSNSVGGTTTTGIGALHELFVPPLLPAHVHDHGFVPPPVTTLAVPGLQRFVVGAVAVVTPLAVPQSPATGGGTTGTRAVHIGLGAPPLVPPHVHDHGPVAPPDTADAGPEVAVQSAHPDGTVVVVVPFAVPQTPGAGGMTTGTRAVQLVFALPG
jgi:hypothetical protein